MFRFGLTFSPTPPKEPGPCGKDKTLGSAPDLFADALDGKENKIAQNKTTRKDLRRIDTSLWILKIKSTKSPLDYKLFGAFFPEASVAFASILLVLGLSLQKGRSLQGTCRFVGLREVSVAPASRPPPSTKTQTKAGSCIQEKIQRTWKDSRIVEFVVEMSLCHHDAIRRAGGWCANGWIDGGDGCIVLECP